MSGKKEEFTPEFLNAFVDDQLTAEEKAEAYEWINQNTSLNQEVCELRKIQDLVQLGYKKLPAPPSGPIDNNSRKKKCLFGIAASLTLALGIAMGVYLGTHALTSAEVTASTPAKESVSANLDTSVKLLVHLNSGDDERLKEALDEVEQLMKYYRETRQVAQVEVITNGRGIKLLGQDTSPYVDRVLRMQREYSNLKFVACQNTLDNIIDETGFPLRLIPGVIVTDSGVAQIMRRQHQGWAYIRG
ncbi:MAG: hypothetical protein BMS9Abin33_0342 [Gammaproteobacteria bacterium]|nr:MAG: hypothetical protein BMS9Abin33_0342 [Gammaproteobacteria bacterium]